MNDQTGKYSARYTYRGWYPVTDLLAETGTRRLYYTAAGEQRNFIFAENRYRLSVSVPQSFISNELMLGFIPSINVGITQATPHRNTPDSIMAAPNNYLRFRESIFYSQEYRFFTYLQRRSVARDLFPRYGQQLDIQYRHTPFGKYDMGNIFSARGITYLPGLIRHHGIRFTAGYQVRNAGENERVRGIYRMFYGYGNLIPYPRGIIGHSHKSLFSTSADYAFPLFYPDVAIPSIIYMKRIRANVFFDYASATGFPANNRTAGKKEIFSSPGFGLQTDSQVFRLPATVVIGFQVAFPQYNRPWFQFLYNISF
jgi:outer membrane protein assembly factor BamA